VLDNESEESEELAEAERSTPLTIMPEFATGKRVDLTSHKNVQLLPSLQECGVPFKDELPATKPSPRIFTPKLNTLYKKYPWVVRLVNEGIYASNPGQMNKSAWFLYQLICFRF